MTRVLVSGLINFETTLRVESFPLDYCPVLYPFHGANSTISGVGYNVARALAHLGNQVQLCSFIGQDLVGKVIEQALARENFSVAGVLSQLTATPQSVIIYTRDGRRQIHVDLKDIQDIHYPQPQFLQALAGCDLAVLCNINFSRPFLAAAREMGKPVACDVHTIASVHDEFNRDFMAAADILFLSHEQLPVPPAQFIEQLRRHYRNQIIVIGMGSAGALLYVRADNSLQQIPAVATTTIVNSIGAGDALFSCFLHCYAQTHQPYQSLRKATVFASRKIGVNGGGCGFLTEAELTAWCQRLQIT